MTETNHADIRMDGLLLLMAMETLFQDDPHGLFTFDQLIELGHPKDVIRAFQERLESKSEREFFATEVEGIWITTEEIIRKVVQKYGEE